MKKSYLTFVENLREEFIRATGADEAAVRFKRKEEQPQTDEDRLYLFLREENGKKIGCGIYTQELYEVSDDEEDLQEIVKAVLNRMNRIQQLQYMEKSQQLTDYEKVSPRLFIRLLNYTRNKRELEGAVYECIGDIALVLYQKLGEQENTVISVKIRESTVALWDLDKKTVMENAMKNTCKMSPPRFYIWERLLEDPDYDGETFMEDPPSYQMHKGFFGNCLSTTVKTNGAVAAFFPGVAEKISELLGSGFYLVFTSIHEVMIHNDLTADPEELREILRDTIRKATPPREILSYQIYHYDQKRRKFTVE